MVPSLTDYRLTILVGPAESAGFWEIAVQNTGAKTLWEMQFKIYELLGATEFGIDDTHMPAPDPSEGIVTIARIEPEERVSITVPARWGDLSYCEHRYLASHYISFSAREDGQARYALNASFTVLDAGGRALRSKDVTKSTNRASLGFRIGEAFGRWIRR